MQVILQRGASQQYLKITIEPPNIPAQQTNIILQPVSLINNHELPPELHQTIHTNVNTFITS